MKHVKSEDNYLADDLSRMRLGDFKNKVKCKIQNEPTPVPELIWPIDKVWEM